MGFRTPSGVVTTTQTFKTIEIPRLVRGKPDRWDPLVCLNWGDQFLTFLQDLVPSLEDVFHSEKHVPVWRVKFTPRTGVSVGLLDEAGVEDVVGGEDRVGFLPRWYWDELQTTKEHSQQGEDHAQPADVLSRHAVWQI